MATAKSSMQRRLPDSVIDKGLEESLPIGVQKSYFMLTETERNMLIPLWKNIGRAKALLFW